MLFVPLLDVTGIEIAAEAIRKARLRAARRNIHSGYSAGLTNVRGTFEIKTVFSESSS